MKKIDKDWLFIFSELFVNLAAGWFGIVFIVPNFSYDFSGLHLLILTADIIVGIVSLVIAFILRKLAKEK